MQIKTRGYAALVFGLVTGALVPIVLELATQMSLAEFFLLTYAIGTAFAMLLVFATGKQHEAASCFRQPGKFGLIALIGLLTYLPFGAAILFAERYVSAALATVVFRTSPLLMLIFIPVILRERLSKSQVVALTLAFVGIYVALTGGQLGIVFSNPDIPVLLMLVLAAGGYAIASLLMKKYIFDMPSELLIFNVSAVALFGVAFVATGAVLSPIQPGYVLAMLLVAGDNVIGFYTYFYSFRLLKTTLVTNVYFLSPFLTLLFAGLLLGEAIQPYYLLIAVLVTAGLVIQRFDTVGGTYKAAKPQRTRNFVIFDVSGAFADTGEAGIASTLNDGGRILAVSLPARHRETVVQRLAQGGYSNVFTSEHSGIANEVAFVKDMIGSKPEDMVLLKAGTFEEGEDFFGDMADLVEPEPQHNEGA